MNPRIKYDQPCPVCKATGWTTINTYKHYWHWCNDCGNVVRERKSTYLVPKLLPRAIISLFSEKAAEKLYPMKEVRNNEARFFDVYKDASSANPEQTKWAGLTEQIVKEMRENGVELRGKTILDVSGGPGFLVKDLQGIARRAVATEYSDVSVDGMARNLGIEVKKFDYQNDLLHEIFDIRFDVILVRYSINFCNDLNRFVSSLRRVMHSDSVIYVGFVPPTLGACLRWHYDEYAYNMLYQPETMNRVFVENGFYLANRWIESTYGCSENRNWLFNVADLLMPYRIAARTRSKSINRELMMNNLVHIYRVNSRSQQPDELRGAYQDQL